MDQVPFPPAVLIILFVWSLIWKGLALWRAAKFEQRNWFIALLILNTIGILEIIYLFMPKLPNNWSFLSSIQFSKKTLTFKEMKSWFSK